MQSDWKPARLVIAVALAMGLLGAGCSGINTSQSVSPATFLLPGFFGQAPPTPPAIPTVPLAAPSPVRASGQTIAQAN